MYLSGVIYLESLLQCWRGLVSIVLSQTSSLSLWVGYPLPLRACACGWEPWRSMAESTEWWSPRRRYLCDTLHQWLLLPFWTTQVIVLCLYIIVEFAHNEGLLTFVIKQYFIWPSSVCISESCLCTRLVSEYIATVYLSHWLRWYVRGGGIALPSIWCHLLWIHSLSCGVNHLYFNHALTINSTFSLLDIYHNVNHLFRNWKMLTISWLRSRPFSMRQKKSCVRWRRDWKSCSGSMRRSWPIRKSFGRRLNWLSCGWNEQPSWCQGWLGRGSDGKRMSRYHFSCGIPYACT